MIRAGILSVSDGRARVHEGLAPVIAAEAERIARCLAQTGEVEPVPALRIACDSRMAVEESRALAAQGIDALILNIPVFAFPNFSALAAAVQCVPLCAIAPINGALPGLGGLQAATNMIRQSGGQCEKVWGNIDEPGTLARVMRFLRAAHARTALRGQVYGLIGGRSIGIGSGQAPQDDWMRLFGVDVEHVDQSEIVRRAELADAAEVERALGWLEGKCRRVAYDGGKLTRENLARQVRCYIATRSIIEDYKMDFVGVKCHIEMSEYHVTQCLGAALLNDGYDWNGAHKPVVFSCEADSDGALTMQVMHLIASQPVMFADFRFYDREDGLFAFCNCGSMATWYAGRSDNPDDNLSRVTLCPVIPKYAGSGCHVQFIAKGGPATLGRLTRVLGNYKLTLFRGEVVEADERKLANTSTAWPHAFVRVAGDPMALVDRYDSNHVHAVAGDRIEELALFCRLAGIECEVIGE